jgi:hypothetical protein
MVDAVAFRLARLCVIDPVAMVLLIIVSVCRLVVLSTMHFGCVMRGIRHGRGRNSPHRRKRGNSKRQTCDKDGPEPAHNVQQYVTGAPGVK